MARAEWVRRGALALAGIVLGVLLLEAGLQALALVVGPQDRTGPLGRRGGGLRVLCIGDSNTFGLWLKRAAPRRVVNRYSLWPATASDRRAASA